MKLLICGDLHLDEKAPKNRPDFVQDQDEKMRWIFNLAKEEDVEAVLQPGDMCNSYKMSDQFKSKWIRFFNKYDIPVFTVPGQHDMRYHSSDIKNTPMGVFEAARVVNILGTNAICFSGTGETKIYGAGWEQSPSYILDNDALNILVIHQMVSEKALWPGHEFTEPKALLNLGFDLIVSGDNHKRFFAYHNGKSLVNCGSLMRSSIDQANHIPIVYILNTKDVILVPHSIPIKPFKEVMNLEQVEKEKERNKELDDFVEGLSDTNVEGLDFKKNIIDHLEKNKEHISKGVIDIINEVLG